MTAQPIPGAVAFIDQANNVRHILELGHIVRFARCHNPHVHIVVNTRNVSRQLHLQIAYTLSFGEPLLRFYESSSTGTFVQSVRRHTMYANGRNPVSAYNDAVRCMRGSDSRHNLLVCEMHLSMFTGQDKSRIMLGELHSDVYFQVRNADKMFYEACIANDVERALYLRYNDIASASFFSAERTTNVVGAAIEANNGQLLTMFLHVWQFPDRFINFMHMAIRLAHVGIFKILWHNKPRPLSGAELQDILKTAVAWQHVHVITYLGHDHGIAVAHKNIARFQARTRNVASQLALKLFAGAGHSGECSSKHMLAFLCLSEVPVVSVLRANLRGKWPACTSMCDSCSNLVHAADTSKDDLVTALHFEFNAHATFSINSVRFGMCKRYITAVVRSRGWFQPAASVLAWFSQAGKSAIRTYVLANQRLRNQPNCESLPIELQLKIASFFSHADWSHTKIVYS